MIEAADPSRILVLDDFLPDYDPELELQRPLTMPTNYRESGYLGTEASIENLGRFHDVLANLPRACRAMGLPALKKVGRLLYIVSDSDSPFHSNIHTDDTSVLSWGYTFSYHWQGLEGSGGTEFYSDMEGHQLRHRVEFRPNRLVAFPARYPHTGYAHPDQPNSSRRVILAVFAELDPRRY